MDINGLALLALSVCGKTFLCGSRYIKKNLQLNCSGYLPTD
jgi:hypothetical protein